MVHLGRRTAIVLVFVSIWGCATARAQEATRLSAGFGAGLAVPLHADFGFTAATWEASVRFGISPHLMVEGAFSDWHHTETSLMSNITLQGPDGIVGHADRITDEVRRTGRTVQMNLLGRFTAGRAELFAGGGGGLFTLSRRFRQTLSGCTSSVAGACQDSENDFSAGSFAAQFVGGGNVRLTRRLSAFGQLRFSLPLEDVGSGDVRFVSGVRVALQR